MPSKVSVKAKLLRAFFYIVKRSREHVCPGSSLHLLFSFAQYAVFHDVHAVAIRNQSLIMCYHDCLSKAVAKVDTFFESTNDLPLFFAMNMIFCSFAQDKGYCSCCYRHSVV